MLSVKTKTAFANLNFQLRVRRHSGKNYNNIRSHPTEMSPKSLSFCEGRSSETLEEITLKLCLVSSVEK